MEELSEIIPDFGDKLKEARMKQGKSQREFASELNMTQQAISKMENGKMLPKWDRLPEFAKLMDISLFAPLNDSNETPLEHEINQTEECETFFINNQCILLTNDVYLKQHNNAITNYLTDTEIYNVDPVDILCDLFSLFDSEKDIFEFCEIVENYTNMSISAKMLMISALIYLFRHCSGNELSPTNILHMVRISDNGFGSSLDTIIKKYEKENSNDVFVKMYKNASLQTQEEKKNAVMEIINFFVYSHIYFDKIQEKSACRLFEFIVNGETDDKNIVVGLRGKYGRIVFEYLKYKLKNFNLKRFEKKDIQSIVYEKSENEENRNDENLKNEKETENTNDVENNEKTDDEISASKQDKEKDNEKERNNMARHNIAFLTGFVIRKPEIHRDENTQYALCSINVVRGYREVGDGKTFMKNDNPMILSRDPGIVSQMEEWKENDIVLVKGVIATKKILKTSECEYCGKQNTKEGILVYINPLYILKMAHCNTQEEALNTLSSLREISNQVSVIGTVSGIPRTIACKEGLDVTRYQIALNRKYFIHNELPEPSSEFPCVYSYGQNAKEDRLRLHAGSVVYIDGCLQVRSIQKHTVCESCGQEYVWKDRTMEIVPYETEYIRDYYTDEDLLEMKDEVI